MYSGNILIRNVFTVIVTLGGLTWATEPADIQLNGSASYEFGQVVKGQGAEKARAEYDQVLNHAWLQQATGHFGADVTLAPGLAMKIGFNFDMVFSYMSSANVLWQSTLFPKYRLYPTDIQGIYTLGDVQENKRV